MCFCITLHLGPPPQGGGLEGATIIGASPDDYLGRRGDRAGAWRWVGRLWGGVG